MNEHFHTCLCGNSFSCAWHILPAPGTRILCREWEQYGLCDQCWASIIAGQGIEILQSVAESEGDPVTAAQAKQKLNSI